MSAPHASRPFVEELPALLVERGMSIRAVARAAGVGDDHLSRVLRGARSKKASPELTSRVAVALGLPEDYFIEARLDFVSRVLAQDPALLNRVYARLRKARASG